MSYIIPPDKGLHFAFGPWPSCAIAAVGDPGIGLGDMVILATAPLGSEEYDAVSILFQGNLQAAANAAGSLGAFLMGLVPTANAAMQALLDKHPAFAPIQASDPATVDNINIALEEYFEIVPSADGNYPVERFKPYTPT